MGAHGNLKKGKQYSMMFLLNHLAAMNKTHCDSRMHGLINRIIRLPNKKREIFIQDLETAIENRLNVLEEASV